MERTRAVEEHEIMAERLGELEALRVHEGNHLALHMLEIEFDRQPMHENPAEIDRFQDRQFAAFGVDAEIVDLAKP